MKLFGVLRSARAIAVTAIIAGLLTGANARAQQALQPMQVRVNQSDMAAAGHVSNIHLHVMPSPLVKSATPPIAVPVLSQSAINQILGHMDSNPLSSPALLSVPEIFSLGFFPDDVGKTATGHVVVTAKHHFVYVNCPSATCWGSQNPNVFMANLGASNFIHLLDQYVGSTANNRYTVGTPVAVSFSPLFSNTLSENEILGIVHAAAKVLPGQVGYGHIYHVFLPQGYDTCFNPFPFGGGCYSPDNPSTFVFCAYHESVTFTDIGHVIYSVEPFQGPISGKPNCAIPFATPNGQLIDSTSTTLLHEIFEAFSDPDPSTGFTVLRGPQRLQEIGDVCGGVFGVTALNAHNYETQLIYSNSAHACTNGP